MYQKDQKGAVAAGHRLTAEAARDILRQGGNAFDAAIAAAWMACVCEPVLASPGGGGFAMVSRDGDPAILVDFFAQTPMRHNQQCTDFREISADFGTATQTFHIGEATSATPGFIPGLFELHRQAASIAMADLVQPAYRHARDGFVITPFQHFLSTVVAPILTDSAPARKIFAPDGNLFAAGEKFINKGLTTFLDYIASDVCYPGNAREVTREIVARQAECGHLTDEDFSRYKVEVRTPLKLAVGPAAACLNPPPSAGGALVAAAFGVLSGDSDVDAARALGVIDEARMGQGLGPDEVLARFGPPSWRGTTHISVVDARGGACAMTLSNGEGNGGIVGDFGFMLNNMLGEADINPHGAAGWPENVRMSSMMCPAILQTEDGAKTALGTGGSNRIRSVIFQVLRNYALKGMAAKAAVDAPRFHVEEGHLDFEAGFDEETIAGFIKNFPDHRAWPGASLFFGGCHIAGRTGMGEFTGAGDRRREGVFLIA